MRKLENFTVLLILFITGLFFAAGCNSSDSGTQPVPGNQLAPPTNISVSLSGASGTAARVTWTKSTDNSAADFAGYYVITNKVDSVGTNLGKADSALVVKTDSAFHVISLDPSRSTYYQTKVYSVKGDGTRSQAATSVIYAGVYETTGATIDEYSTIASAAKSGYGWDPFLGLGTQLAYSAGNAAKIDLHLRMDGAALKFFSPNNSKVSITNGHNTLISLLGTGKAAYDKAEGLAEPALNELEITPDNVYLIKTQGGIYVKIWVKSVGKAGSNSYNTVTFDYKLQPIAGLRVLKR